MTLLDNIDPQKAIYQRQIVESAWRAVLGRDPSPFEAGMVHAISWSETKCGESWTGAGVGSHNWGGVQARPGQPSFPWSDSRPDGSRFSQPFRTYPNDLEGCKDTILHLTPPQYPLTGAAMQTNQVHNVSDAMFREHYYGSFCPQALAKYGDAVKASYGFPENGGNHATTEAGMACENECVRMHEDRIRQILGELSDVLGIPNPEGGGGAVLSSSRWWLLLGGAAVVGWWKRDAIGAWWRSIG